MKADTRNASIAAHESEGSWRTTAMHALPFVAVFGFAAIVPMVTNDYWALIATRAAIYWLLVSGLNLVGGFAGNLGWRLIDGCEVEGGALIDRFVW